NGDLSFDIHLANADGMCDVVIYSGESAPSGISYRYYDHGDGTGTGKIDWAKKWDTNAEGSLSVIRMLEFHVANNRVTDTLPVPSELLLQHPLSPAGHFYRPNLAPDGTRLVYESNESLDGSAYLAELDLADCPAPPCISRFLETASGEAKPQFAKYSLSWSRVYFKVYQSGNGWPAFGFVDRVADTWSEPTIVEHPDVQDIDVGLWDWDEDGYAEEVLAVESGFGAGAAIEIWGCLDPGETPCLVLSGITGQYPTIKSIDGKPSLIYTYVENKRQRAIFEYDLNMGTTRMLIDSVPGRNANIWDVDAAD
ncbi:MAG: hypothetical protein OQJ84_09980, partial [Xanthomonadales bacterium]|nr:hypothetical protein [Xanthomonadales bacterium]